MICRLDFKANITTVFFPLVLSNPCLLEVCRGGKFFRNNIWTPFTSMLTKSVTCCIVNKPQNLLPGYRFFFRWSKVCVVWLATTYGTLQRAREAAVSKTTVCEYRETNWWLIGKHKNWLLIWHEYYLIWNMNKKHDKNITWYEAR